MFPISNFSVSPDCLIVRALVPMDKLSCFCFLVLPFSQDAIMFVCLLVFFCGPCFSSVEFSVLYFVLLFACLCLVSHI